MINGCHAFCAGLLTCNYETKQKWARVTGIILQIISLIGILALAKVGSLSQIETTTAACMLTFGFVLFIVVRYLRKPLHDDIRKEISEAVIRWPEERGRRRLPVSMKLTFKIFAVDDSIIFETRKTKFVFTPKSFDFELSKLLDHPFFKLEGKCKAVYDNGDVRVTSYIAEMKNHVKTSKIEHLFIAKT